MRHQIRRSLDFQLDAHVQINHDGCAEERMGKSYRAILGSSREMGGGGIGMKVGITFVLFGSFNWCCFTLSHDV